MAASLSRARLPSTDKQLLPHTVQMPYLTVPAIPGKRNIVQIMTILCFLQDHVHVDKNDGTVLLPFSLYSISVQTLFCSLCILLPFSLHHIDGLQIINKNRLCFIGTKEQRIQRGRYTIGMYLGHKSYRYLVNKIQNFLVAFQDTELKYVSQHVLQNWSQPCWRALKQEYHDQEDSNIHHNKILVSPILTWSWVESSVNNVSSAAFRTEDIVWCKNGHTRGTNTVSDCWMLIHEIEMKTQWKGEK